MKNSIVFVPIAIFLFLGLKSQAQTKRIAHRSHAGTLTNYVSYENDNLGLSREMERFYDSIYNVKKILKDSLVFIATVDSTKLNKNTKTNPRNVKPVKVKRDTAILKKKTEPLPPNLPDDEQETKEKPKKSSLFLLFLVALPISTIAYLSGRK